MSIQSSFTKPIWWCCGLKLAGFSSIQFLALISVWARAVFACTPLLPNSIHHKKKKTVTAGALGRIVTFESWLIHKSPQSDLSQGYIMLAVISRTTLPTYNPFLAALKQILQHTSCSYTLSEKKVYICTFRGTSARHCGSTLYHTAVLVTCDRNVDLKEPGLQCQWQFSILI